MTQGWYSNFVRLSKLRPNTSSPTTSKVVQFIHASMFNNCIEPSADTAFCCRPCTSLLTCFEMMGSWDLIALSLNPWLRALLKRWCSSRGALIICVGKPPILLETASALTKSCVPAAIRCPYMSFQALASVKDKWFGLIRTTWPYCSCHSWVRNAKTPFVCRMAHGKDEARHRIGPG